MKHYNNYHSSFVGKFIFGAFICLTFMAASFAQTTGVNLTDQNKLVTEFEVNGLKVLIKRRPNSQTVAAGLFFRGGVRNVTAQTAGIEGFALNVATTGSQKYPRDILRRELAKTGSSIGAGASYDYSTLSMLSTRDNFDRSWDIFTDVALNPAFANDDVELTREAILSGLRNQNDAPDSNLEALQDQVIYANTTYANDPNGTIETVSKLTANDLRAYHKKSLETSRLLLVIVGDLDANTLKTRITESFGKLSRGDYKDLPVPTLDFSKPTLDITSRNLPTNYIQGVFAAPSLSNPDFYAMRVATTILRDKVFEEVRVKRNLSYAPSADMDTKGSNTGNIYVTAVDANQSISVMLNEINALKTETVEDREISGVTGQFLTTYYVGQETNIAQVGELARYELIGGGWRNSFEFINQVKKVTPQDVQRVSQKYIKNLRFIVLGNPAAINRQIFLGQGE
jgi:zinc protease